MNRRSLLLSLPLALALASPLWAGFEEDVVRQLREQGYVEIRVSHTLLGRVRVLASRADGTREIILNPRTGEILRDLFIAGNGGVASVPVLRSDNSGKGSGDDNDDDDDDSGHGGGDDHSGHGGGNDNSGHGGGDDDDD